MFNFDRQRQVKRLILIRFIVLLTFLFFSISLFEKTILGHKYYSSLSNSNRTKEVKSMAPRGVFLDYEGIPLVSNEKSLKYGYQRDYLYPEETAHLLGYLSLPTKESLDDYSCGTPPLLNQFIGMSGLEKFDECRLRGKYGGTIIEVDALGQKKRELARVNPIEGENIQLSLVIKLQQKAHTLFKGKKGAVIATDPQTGKVLLFYSSPSYDNNALLKEPGLYSQLAADPDKPLYNRLTLGLYPPGSVIKPVIALGALEDKVINPATTYEDKGIFKLGNLEFGNWYFLQYGKTEGEVDVVKAIKRSNDIFFYHLGSEMGVSKINNWLKLFGLENRDLADYFPQNSGSLPTNTWKKKTIGEPWYLGDTVNLSIGQGYLLVNPVQMHQAISVIASNGYHCDLKFVKKEDKSCQNLRISQENLSLIIEGMRQACASGGTGYPFFDFKVKGKPISVACKTGTAETGSETDLPHAWFTAFAPIHDPQIVLTILVENGGEGSSVAAPIAKEILMDFFSLY